MIKLETGTNPFKITSSRSVYENPWIHLVEHQIINPKGNPGIYGVVKFKNRAVGVVPYQNGQIWLVGQYRPPLEQYSWEIPAGGSPKTEDLAETAQRELQEEVGLIAQRMDLVLEMHLSNSITDEYSAIFLARDLTLGPSSPEETEELAVKKIKLEDAYELVTKGQITDSLSVGAILKLMLMRHEGILSS